MISPNASFVMSDKKQYAAWLLAMFVATLSFRNAKGIIAFVLDNCTNSLFKITCCVQAISATFAFSKCTSLGVL